MKFSAINNIDEKKILEKIDYFYVLHQCENPYVFMNNNTLKDLVKDYDWNTTTSHNENIGMYYRCKIYVNNDLKYGEIELR